MYTRGVSIAALTSPKTFVFDDRRAFSSGFVGQARSETVGIFECGVLPKRVKCTKRILHEILG